MNFSPTAARRLIVSGLGSPVLDASAVLAVMQCEEGTDRVIRLLPSAVISAVNVAEVLAKLVQKGVPDRTAVEAFNALNIEVAPFGLSEALSSVSFVHPKLSLGDRACLATATVKGAAAITADTIWKDVATTVNVVCVR